MDTSKLRPGDTVLIAVPPLDNEEEFYRTLKNMLPEVTVYLIAGEPGQQIQLVAVYRP